jgi:ATP-binding cassette subfamily F protein uup
MNILTLEAVSKTYGIKPLFNKIDFSIHEKDKIGLIGVNGTGKSTLLKIVSGIEEPDEGRVTKGGQIRLEYLPQNPDFDQPMSVLDYVFSGESKIVKLVYEYQKVIHQLEQSSNDMQLQNKLNELISQMDRLEAWEWETQAKTILTRLGITEFSKAVQTLSGGEKKRVAMARTLIHAVDILILDEPTNHIDHTTVEWLEDYLSKFKGALVLITHDRYFLDRVVNQIVELDQGKLYKYKGNYSQFLDQKRVRLEQLASSEDKHNNLLRRELAWLHKGAKARTTKQKARIDRVNELRDTAFDVKNESVDFSALGGTRLGKKVLEIEHVSKKIENRLLINDFNYIVVPGDRLGIIGRNGSGKSTLLNILAGKLTPDEGAVHRGETVRLSYYDQENMNLDLNLKVIDYIKDAAEVIHGADGSTLTASQMLERFLFVPEIQWSTISRLSGGEKRRLYLLRKLMEEPNVLLLDEPTNDLDIQTLTILEDYLEQFNGSVIIVSHDRYFLDRTVDHLFSFEENGTLTPFMGNYTSFLEKKELEDDVVKNLIKEDKSAPEEKQNTQNKPRKLGFMEQREYDQIDEKIALLEEKNAHLLEQINQAGSDYEKLQKLSEEQLIVSKEIENTLERWAVLSEIAEG